MVFEAEVPIVELNDAPKEPLDPNMTLDFGLLAARSLSPDIGGEDLDGARYEDHLDEEPQEKVDLREYLEGEISALHIFVVPLSGQIVSGDKHVNILAYEHHLEACDKHVAAHHRVKVLV